MKINITLENLLNNSKEVKIIKIFKTPGDAVEAGDILFEVEADKVNTTVKSEASGNIEKINLNVGDIVKINDVLAVIDGEKVTQGQINALNNFSYFGNLVKPLKQELTCDITIIGGGPGGYVAAIHAAKLGAKVILIEKEKLGGTCLNYGCIPTKSFVRSAQVYNTLKRAEEFGCYADNISFSMKSVVERKNKVVSQLVQGIDFLMNKNNIKVINGVGEIADKETVFVKEKSQEITIKTKDIIIATGSKSAKPPIKGIDNKNVINSNDALELQEAPEKMVIIGGGVIGMEFAYIFANFGTNVSVVEYCDECLMMCDDDIRRENTKMAEHKGIKIYTGSKVEGVEAAEDGECIVCFVNNDEKKYISAQKVLVAVGRMPYIEGFDFEKLGIELNENKRGIRVNPKMQTSVPNIYAIGDVTNKVLLAHAASHQGIVAVNNIMGKPCEMDYKNIPSAIFTDPEIAIVGINEKEASKEGIEIEVGKFPFSANGKALTFGEPEGFIKLIKEKSSGKIIGGSIVGLHATDLIAEVTLAVKNDLTVEQIIETIHAHPTTAEVIHEAALGAEGRAIHFA